MAERTKIRTILIWSPCTAGNANLYCVWGLKRLLKCVTSIWKCQTGFALTLTKMPINKNSHNNSHFLLLWKTDQIKITHLYYIMSGDWINVSHAFIDKATTINHIVKTHLLFRSSPILVLILPWGKTIPMGGRQWWKYNCSPLLTFQEQYC